MLESLLTSFNNNLGRNAFYIKDEFYKYEQLLKYISGIKKLIESENLQNKNIGLMTFDDIETYSSIFAILFSGNTFVPIDFNIPPERNIAMLDIADIDIIITSDENDAVNGLRELCQNIKFINTSGILNEDISIKIQKYTIDDTAYILFTSGSTGIPKAVPISYKNISSFIKAFFEIGFEFNCDDKSLQSSDLTFDLSTMSYFTPLLKGACVYTVPTGGIKFSRIYKLLEEQEITIALLVPVILNYLKPYFNDILLTKLRYCLFCGEALYDDMVEKWYKCIPNAKIFNVYGPTEATNFCSFYEWNPEKSNRKTYNGIISIGKPMNDVEMIIIDEEIKLLKENVMGELCLSGPQVTTGYLKKDEKNKEVFITINYKDKTTVFYKTGDLAYYDEEGDFMYCGRKDFQLKIQGYRVELSEIEFYVRELTNGKNAVAVPYQSENGSTLLHLFIENYKDDLNQLLVNLKRKIPGYMIPQGITILDEFPLNKNGKIDRKKIASYLTK